MAVQGPFEVEHTKLFTFGAACVGEVSPIVDFDASTKDHKVQARDKATGLPLWHVDVMDFDPEARERTVKVKIAAAVQPELPAVMENTPLRPVYLEGLTVTPYIKETGNGRARIAYSLRATGLTEPRRPHQGKAA